MLGSKPMFTESSQITVMDIVVVDQIAPEQICFHLPLFRRDAEVMGTHRPLPVRGCANVEGWVEVSMVIRWSVLL